jgi:hypothetical protein
VRSDGVVDDAESVDLRVQGVASVITPRNRYSYFKVQNHLSMTPLVWGDRTRVRTCRSGGSGPSNAVLNTSPRKAGTVAAPPRSARAPCRASPRPARAPHPARRWRTVDRALRLCHLGNAPRHEPPERRTSTRSGASASSTSRRRSPSGGLPEARYLRAEPRPHRLICSAG